MWEHSLTQEDLARMAHVSQRAVSDWVNRVTPLPMYAAIIFAERFNCSIDFLINKSDENRKPKDNGTYKSHYSKI